MNYICKTIVLPKNHETNKFTRVKGTGIKWNLNGAERDSFPKLIK